MELFKKHRAIIVALVIAIVLIVSAFYAIGAYARAHLSTVVTPKAMGPMSFNVVSLSDSNFMGYSNFKSIVAYTLLNYTESNASSLNVSFNVYASNPVYNIYLLNVSGTCYQCYGINQVYQSLTRDLAKFDLLKNATFNMVGEQDAGSVPQNSIIIIPSGLVPVELMPASGYSYATTLLTLLSRGDVVIYIGDNFSRSIGPNGVIFQSNPTTESALGASNITYSEYTGRVNKSSGIYSFSFSSPTFSLPGGMYYSATYGRALNGTLLSFSNTPTNSWSNYSSMSMDVARLISTRFWLLSIAEGTYNSTPSPSGTAGIFTFNKPANASLEGILNNTYPFIQAVAYNSTDYIVDDVPFKIRWQTNGTISLQARVPETESVPIIISMMTHSISNRTIMPHIDIFNKQMGYAGTIPVGFFKTSSNISVIKYASFSLPPGPYILVLRDITNRYYSSSIFDLENVSIIPIETNFKNGTFAFTITSGGVPVNNTAYSISLNNGYASNGTISNGALFYSLPRGTVVSYGTEDFAIRMLGTNFTYSTPYTKTIFHIPIYYIEFAIVIVAIIVLNMILKAPSRDEYYIDVPDFRPESKLRVAVKESDILSLFDKVNYYHHWRYMPLTAEEVKSSIAVNLRYGNMPISVTTQNTNLILSQLVHGGKLLEKNNYYTPSSWVAESGHDEEYLTVFRMLRDFCVTHGMLFTELNSSEVADMVITKSGSERYIIIYTSKGKVRPIRMSSEGKVYFVFIDEDTMNNFMESLYSSVGEEAELIKIGISSGNIKVVDTQHLDEIA